MPILSSEKNMCWLCDTKELNKKIFVSKGAYHFTTIIYTTYL